MGYLLRRVLAAATLSFTLAPAAAGTTPNIVFILVDDLDAATAAQMPMVKALIADRGASFHKHYVNVSLCCPSRISGLRGQFAHNTTIFTNGPPDGGFWAVHKHEQGLEKSTFATWLQAAGYRTALFGKYFNGYPTGAPSETYVPPGWNEWMSPISGTPQNGFDYRMNHNGEPVDYGHEDKDYFTDVISREAADFISRSVSQHPDKPFLVYLAPYAPHSPATPAPRHQNAFPGIKVPRPPSFNEADVKDKPEWVQKQPLLDDDQIKQMDRQYRGRRQSLLAVDDMVQNIVFTLQSKGQLENTYIFFTSDNGFHQGQHRLESGKLTAYEEDILIPLWVRGPGVAAGRKIEGHITANVDYAGTFADIAGIATPSFVDGRSLLPLLRGLIPPAWRAALLLENKGGETTPLLDTSAPLDPLDPFELVLQTLDGGPGITGFTGLRVNDGTTYLEYVTKEYELYDNEKDPYQLTNAYLATPPERRAELARWVAKLKKANGSKLRQAEQAPPPR